jgi:hypothetical protein
VVQQLAAIRVVHCVLDPDAALERALRRRREKPVCRAHADPGPEQRELGHKPFERVSIDAPWMKADTTDGYEPDLERIVAFAAGRAEKPASEDRKVAYAHRPIAQHHEGLQPPTRLMRWNLRVAQRGSDEGNLTDQHRRALCRQRC